MEVQFIKVIGEVRSQSNIQSINILLHLNYACEKNIKIFMGLKDMQASMTRISIVKVKMTSLFSQQCYEIVVELVLVICKHHLRSPNCTIVKELIHTLEHYLIHWEEEEQEITNDAKRCPNCTTLFLTGRYSHFV